jgi:hypothetical protein
MEKKILLKESHYLKKKKNFERDLLRRRFAQSNRNSFW